MLPFFRRSFGNPGTPHQVVGGEVQRAISDAREAVAKFVNCLANEILWTSGATESNNLAILGFAATAPSEKRHIITQVTEHSAVLEPCRHLESNGWRVTYLPVDQYGQVSVDQLKESLTDETSLVSIMWGNNEIGTIQPVEEIACLCVEKGVVFHCDAVQAAGRVTIDVDNLPVSMLSLSAHKVYGPKGAGALFVRDLSKQSLISPRVFGGGQERGYRPGTLNVPCVVGMGAACSLAFENAERWQHHVRTLRDLFEALLLNELNDVSINGSVENRLPHVSNIAFYGTDNEGVLTLLPELVASTGAACHVADFTPSHVLTALKKKPDISDCSIRFGFGKDNTDDEVLKAVGYVCSAVRRLREA